MLLKPGGYASIILRGKPGLYWIQFYPGAKQPISMVLKYKYHGLPMGVCNSLDILRKDIQNLPGVCKDIWIIADVQVSTKHNWKGQNK